MVEVLKGFLPPPGIRWRILGKFPHSYKTDKELKAWEEAHGSVRLDPYEPEKSEKACRSLHIQSLRDGLASEPLATPQVLAAGDRE